MALNDDDVREILRIIDESALAELHIETEGFSLHVVRGGAAAAAAGLPGGRRSVSGSGADRARGQAEAAAPAPAADTPALAEDPADVGPGEADGPATITAPMLGTFYRAEAPGQPPFVEVGKRVEPDTTVCIIEVMKMMNSVPAGVSGTIAEVVAENAQLVEYGQPLFRVEPA